MIFHVAKYQYEFSITTHRFETSPSVTTTFIHMIVNKLYNNTIIPPRLVCVYILISPTRFCNGCKFVRIKSVSIV